MEAREYAKEVVDESLPPSCSPTLVRTKWRPPQHGRYKINVDGAMFTGMKSCGIRVVIRNEVGHIMEAMSKYFPLPLGALEVEALAMEEGLILVESCLCGKWSWKVILRWLLRLSQGKNWGQVQS